MYGVKEFEETSVNRREFLFWFVRKSLNTFTVTQLGVGSPIGELVEYEGEDIQYEFNPIDSSVSVTERVLFEDFEQFKNRPEYLVGGQFDADAMPIEEMINYYEKLLTGVAMIRNSERVFDDESKFINNFQRCLNWLKGTDFYTAPASTIYHEAYQGGLLHHSLKVLSEIYDLSILPKFQSVRFDSMTLVALTHDWCKIGQYIVDYKNAKNADGVWEKVPFYKRNNEPATPLGHGVTSMYLVQKMFLLSLDEACAIRHHMGVWNCNEAEYNDLQEANHRFPIVHMLQFADQLSCTKY